MNSEISGTTKTIALIGNPVSHSLSPAMHNTSFAALNQDCRYLAYEVDPHNLEDAVRGMSSLGFAGYNVSVPFKTAIVPLLDKIDKGADLIGAVNTVKIENGVATGYNTDALSFTETLRQNNIDPSDKNFVIVDIGAEGPAYIAQAALEGARSITVVTTEALINQTEARVARLKEKTNCRIKVARIDKPETYEHGLQSAQVFCNASRIGAGVNAATPLPANLIHPGLTVVDTIYDPRITPLMQDALKAGCKVIGGLELLLNQAALAEKIWLDCDMPTVLIEERYF